MTTVTVKRWSIALRADIVFTIFSPRRNGGLIQMVRKAQASMEFAVQAAAWISFTRWIEKMYGRAMHRRPGGGPEGAIFWQFLIYRRNQAWLVRWQVVR